MFNAGIHCSRVLFYRIRNYMSKEWFLKMTMEAEPSSLAKQIANILKPANVTIVNDSPVNDIQVQLANSAAARPSL